jgi:hypothetical protein
MEARVDPGRAGLAIRAEFLQLRGRQTEALH